MITMLILLRLILISFDYATNLKKDTPKLSNRPEKLLDAEHDVYFTFHFNLYLLESAHASRFTKVLLLVKQVNHKRAPQIKTAHYYVSPSKSTLDFILKQTTPSVAAILMIIRIMIRKKQFSR
ncbi:uncharacterized protein EV154DRAFT_591629 [Mucor mucedo]|uniref:uncharacterized protein n=1 Tax=Mucor mucedo TaxID=29922 RepID=UPI0022211802|nr:uncharacterized protein EV154DRAFT_591629 [Mucor mucedo]KAI7889695.1 hypothetical protein EV154DRAFT_591629 [Mucor mucedo]